MGEFDWSLLDPKEFAKVFGGNFIMNTIEWYMANMVTPPVKTFEALQWLAEAAKQVYGRSGDDAAVAAVSKEAYQTSFMAVQNEATRTYWLLPSGDVDRILLEVELGLCKYAGGHEDANFSSEGAGFGATVLNSLSFCCPQNVTMLKGKYTFADTAYVNSRTKEPSVAEEIQRRAKKYVGIVLQFPKQSSSISVALEFITEAPVATQRDTHLCVTLLEESIRAYLIMDAESDDDDDDEDYDTVDNLASAFRLPPVSMETFLHTCIEEHASLTIYALGKYLHKSLGKPGEYLALIAKHIPKFVPHKLYQLDIVAVWFSVLDIVKKKKKGRMGISDADRLYVAQIEHMIAAPAAASTLLVFTIDKAQEAMTKRLGIVALACRLFIVKYLRETAPVRPDKKLDEEYASIMGQLVKLRGSKDAKLYPDFFPLLDKFKNSDYMIKKLKKDIATTLCPMVPYLENI